ncbi:MAG: hypothetical protein GY786_17855, partial [Proteobacteria bacterium]|nr:hypothetical protein [Pseudomonadota bacterium]
MNQLKTFKNAQSNLAQIKRKNEAAASKGTEVDNEAESTAENLLLEVETSLASSILEAESFIEKYRSLSTQFGDESMNLDSLLEEEKSSAEAFEKITEGVNWEWDKAGMFDELTSVKKDDVPLGYYVHGKILQYEGNLPESVKNFRYLDSTGSDLNGVPFSLFEAELWSGNEEERDAVHEKY